MNWSPRRVAGCESQARGASACGAEHPGDRRVVGGDVGDAAPDGVADLRGGLRASECCQLRVKEIDQGLVFVRSGKGDRDRSTLLAEVGREPLRAQVRESEAQHQADRHAGLAGVWMPDALDRKYPNAGRELGWFWVFPSRTLSTDPRVGIVRRHHSSDSVIQNRSVNWTGRERCSPPSGLPFGRVSGDGAGESRADARAARPARSSESVSKY